MSKKELDADLLAEQVKKLPAETQERIRYMVQGALLVAGNHTAKGAETVARPGS